MRIRRSFQGALLGLGAPLGWLVWRTLVDSVDPLTELGTHPALYFYLTMSTTLVFAVFALRLARAEARLKRENLDLSAIAVTDALTGLRNSRYFRARLDEAIADAERQQKPLSLVMLDLDHFKRINDSHGHPVGDQVLAEVAHRLAGAVRAADTAARVGGEEFALLLVDTPLDVATSTAERVRARVGGSAIQTSVGPLSVTVSAGVASSHDVARELVAAADEALYRAKGAGRNCVVASAAE